MTSVNVTENKYSVSVTEGVTTVVTVKAPGPQGPGFPDGNLGDVTSSNTGASVVVNSGAITNAKVNDSAAIAGTKISPDFGSQNITTTGNAVFGGNLTVSGTTTTIDSTTLRVEDKNIELGKVGSPTDITADGGGITLLGDTNHTFNWLNATDSWTSSEHIALPDNKKLQVGDSQDYFIKHDPSMFGGVYNRLESTNGNVWFVNTDTTNKFMYIRSGDIQLRDWVNNKAFIHCDSADLGVDLFFSGVKKAETTVIGFNILSGLANVGASIVSNASVPSHAYGHGLNGVHNQGLTIRADESCLELIATGGGRHAGSILIRDTSNDGFGFINDPTNEELQLKSFTTSNHNFFISSTGTNLSRLDNCIVIKKDGSVSLFNDGVRTFETKNYGFVSEALMSDPNILVHKVGHSRGGLAALQTQRLALATTTSGDDIVFGFGSAEPVTSSNFTERLRIDNGTGEIKIPDNGKLQLGDSQDLEIFHDGNHSRIKDTGTGNLFIHGSNTQFLNAAGSETIAKFTENGAVELRHNNDIKFVTSSTGIDVSGKLEVLHPNTNTFSEIKCNGGVSGLRISGSAAASAAFLTFANNHINTLTDRWTFGTANDGASSDMVVYLGSGVTGTERLRVKGDSARVDFSCDLRPEADNTRALGSSSKRFSTLHINSVKASTGILFGSDTAAANTLDDYEEGTFTPTLEGSSSNPTVTYSTQLGHYTKIGNVVHIQLVVVTTSYTGGSGEWQCGGLPFTAHSTAPASFNLGWNQNNKVNWGANVLSLAPYIAAGTTRIRARKFMSDANTALNLSGFSNSETLVFGVHGSYIAA